MTETIASSEKMARGSIPTIEQTLRELPRPGRPPPDSFRSECGDSLPPLPRTSLSVIPVMDDHGYLTPLCTAGDLLRCCKAAWRAERDLKRSSLPLPGMPVPVEIFHS